jgi:hypothetical protein
VNALTSDPHEDVMALVLQQCAKCLKSPEDTEAFLSTPLLFGIVQYVEDAPTDLCNRIASLFSGLVGGLSVLPRMNTTISHPIRHTRSSVPPVSSMSSSPTPFSPNSTRWSWGRVYPFYI